LQGKIWGDSMKNIRLIFCGFYSILIIILLSIACDKSTTNNTDGNDEFNFPKINSIDSNVYDEIKITCEKYWDLNNMEDSTFEIYQDGDEYSVECEGYFEDQLYHFVIRVDKNGKWINDGRTLIPYRDITQILSVSNFESIKKYILKNGDRQTYCNMYNDNPHFSYGYFHVYLNPEIGQANIDCDPQKSDFNEIVIRDQNSEPQYYYLHIVRLGDLENEKIIKVDTRMKENRIYILNPYKNDLNIMEDSVKSYIDIMVSKIK